MFYKGYEIENFGSGYTVCYQGDEIHFETIEEAKMFIEGVVADEEV